MSNLPGTSEYDPNETTDVRSPEPVSGGYTSQPTKPVFDDNPFDEDSGPIAPGDNAEEEDKKDSKPGSVTMREDTSTTVTTGGSPDPADSPQQ